MPGCCSPRSAPASLHVGTDQVGLSRAVGLQLPAQQAQCWPRLPRSILPGLSQENSASLLPKLPEPDDAVLREPEQAEPSCRWRGRRRWQQSFPSAPYIYCKVLWL